MSPLSKRVLLCAALASSLAQAQDLRLRDPLWAEAATPTADSTSEQWRMPLQVVAGLATGVAVGAPAAYAGFQLANRALPPDYYCDKGACDYGYPFGGVLGMLAGATFGLSLGTGFGVAWAGWREGGAFHWGPALFGSAAGAVIALTGSVVLGFVVGSGLFFGLGPVVVPALVATGAVAGSVWAYQGSLPFGPPAAGANVTPVVRLVPGGGVVGIAGTL